LNTISPGFIRLFW